MSSLLLDHRYALRQVLLEAPHERHYRATHTELGVSVRIIAVRSPEGPRLIEPDYFRACATSAARLRHAAIPSLRDFFCCDAIYYAVFDYYDGPSFGTYLARQHHLPLRETLVYALQLCDAFDYVVSRAPSLLPLIPLSPEMLIRSGPASIGLLDLGVIRWLTPALRQLSLANGTGDYMAPEVLAGNAADERSIQYSIAALVAHALVGPSPQDNAAQITQITASQLPSLLSPALRSIIGKALEPRPERRFASLESFGAALGWAARQLMPSSNSTPPTTHGTAPRRPSASDIAMPHASYETSLPASPSRQFFKARPVIVSRPLLSLWAFRRNS